MIGLSTLELRSELNQRFPGLTFYFQPPDIVTQVLNFGLAAPIDVQIVKALPLVRGTI